mgnify:CR=1 FL=1
MPKSNYEIKNFSRGIIANPQDNLDIPEDAATYSLNIDPQVDGSLQGIPTDLTLKPTGFSVDWKLDSYSQGGNVAQSQGPIYNAPPPQEE